MQLTAVGLQSSTASESVIDPFSWGIWKALNAERLENCW